MDTVAYIYSLKKLAFSFAGCASLTEDLLQEAQIKVWLYREHIKGLSDSEKQTYCTAILRHLFFDYYKKKQRRLRIFKDYQAEQVTPSSESDFVSAATFEAVIKANPYARELFLNAAGYSRQEIGQACQITTNTATQRIFKGRKIIKKNFEKWLR